jgi:predicted DNA-binding transcriptional regulator YafY
MRFEGKNDLLRLALLLSGSHVGLGIADVQREFGTTHRTAQRMIAAIRERFPECDEVETGERAKRWRLPASALRGLSGAEPTELAELEAAARRLREEGAAAGQAEALERLAAKLRGAMKAADLRRAEPDVEALMQAEGTAIRPGPRPMVSAVLLAAIRHAMLSFRRIRLRYGADIASIREHVVDPLGLLHGQRPYLVAQIAGTQQGPSVFRLDRVLEHEVLPDPFVRDPSFSLQAYTRRSFGVWQEEPFAVCLRFGGAAAAEAAAFHFHPTQTLDPQPDGTLLVRFTAGGALEMCQHLVTWEDSVEVLEPTRLREQLAAWARKAADHHAHAPGAQHDR